MLSVPVAVPSTAGANEIGRASCRERAKISVDAVSLKKKIWDMAKGPVMVTLLTDTPNEAVLAICFFRAEVGIRAATVPKVRMCALPMSEAAGVTPAPARLTG